jgi:hypothetical protein
MEFNLTWLLYEITQREIEQLEVNNYNQFTLTVIVENDIDGLALNCGLKIFAKNKNPLIKPKVVQLDYLGEYVQNPTNN